jgi:hypothetical protein
MTFPDFDPIDFSDIDFATQLQTGPPYQRYAPGNAPGENAIGTFIIGESQIGDIIPFDMWLTVISQYANSPIITTLIANFQQYVDQTLNMQSLYDNIWNVLTAQGYGLDVWGRIVGIQRVVQIQTTRFFGFEEQTPTVEDFGPGGAGPFYNGVPATSNYALADQAFRQLILAKAAANLSSGSVPSINAILRGLFFGRGNCYVQDNYNMSISYVFKFPITQVELAIISMSGVLPKPSGISSTIVYPGLI